jgi:hypothetical protein
MGPWLMSWLIPLGVGQFTGNEQEWSVIALFMFVITPLVLFLGHVLSSIGSSSSKKEREEVEAFRFKQKHQANEQDWRSK